MVSIPSGRGFWAGHRNQTGALRCSIVSIPSGRGFWAGIVKSPDGIIYDVGLNPLWSGLLGRR